MKRDWSIVEVLQHSRHDWLNKIQLIKGNFALNKTDRVKEIIDEIVMVTQNESKLTNLKLESLATLLMTVNWDQPKFIVEFEVIGEVKNLSQFDETLTNWFEQLFLMLDNIVDLNGDNLLTISIETFEKEVRFILDFSGIIKDKHVVSNWFDHERPKSEEIQLIDSDVHSEEFFATIQITTALCTEK